MPKRGPQTVLTHENWDDDHDDDDVEKEPEKPPQRADENVIKARKILVAKRRQEHPASTGGLFKGFQGLASTNMPAGTSSLFGFLHNTNPTKRDGDADHQIPDEKVKSASVPTPSLSTSLKQLNSSFLAHVKTWVDKETDRNGAYVLIPAIEDYQKYVATLLGKDECAASSLDSLVSFTFREPTFSGNFPEDHVHQPSQNDQAINHDQFDSDEEKREECEEDYSPPDSPQPYQEPGAVFSLKCKLYYLIGESTWQKRGVGLVHVKPLQPATSTEPQEVGGEVSSGKLQLVVRTESATGPILLNTLVTPAMQFRQQKNALYFACVANPPLPTSSVGTDGPKLTSFLLRAEDEQSVRKLLDILEAC